MATAWRAQVLGLTQLEGPDGQRVRMERRTAALLAYLGLEGPSPKASVATLLWPDSSPATTRSNMRQLLRRLRLASGGVELVEADSERLAVGPLLRLDVAILKRAAMAQAHAEVLEALQSGGGMLLGGLDFDDCEELAGWLDGARAAVEDWVRKAREAEIQRHLAGCDWTAALVLAQDWVRQEPSSEQAGCHLIRLHHLRGDRSAALAAFERLRATLSEDLGVTPMPDTLALVRHIEKGTSLPRPAPVYCSSLPLSVLRPPVLAGRAAAWRQLQEGLNSGQLLFITGEPGSGKTRLAEEFAASQGRWVRMEGRPEDVDIPFSSQARSLRVLLARRPDVELADWVRAELSRIVPEMGDASSPPPLASEADELRFYDANVEAMKQLLEREHLVVADDVQYWDKASARVFVYALKRMLESSAGTFQRPCFIDCYRRDELPAYSEAYVRQLVESGMARVIELGPLSPKEVRQLVAGLELPGAEAHADNLARYTGGNPLAIMETLKHLIETGVLHQEWPHRLPPPGRVSPIIQRRLARLSPLALQTAQLAALADSHFRAALAPEALGVSASAVHAALCELEAAQILVGERFSHDLVLEAVRASLPPAAARLLHARLATVLERNRAPARLLAHHWMEAGWEERALPHLLTPSIAHAR